MPTTTRFFFFQPFYCFVYSHPARPRIQYWLRFFVRTLIAGHRRSQQPVRARERTYNSTRARNRMPFVCALPASPPLFLPISNLIESEPQFMPMLCAAFSCVVSARKAQRRCINPFPSSTTPLTRLFDRSEAVESRGLAVVTVLRERAEGGIGGRFWGKVCKLFAVDV